MRVLGIDPGTRCVGYGLVRADGNRYTAEAYGTIKIDPKLDFAAKLLQIYQKTAERVAELKPDSAAVEETYVTQNAKTTLRLGHARGVILLVLAEQELSIGEYAPRSIKQAVSGKGNATKEQVKLMIGRILGMECETIEEDASDALAIALCHVFRCQNQAVSWK